MSTSTSPPKAILFDIGGVCVLSPFQGILDYEAANNIPQGWINYAISRSAPNGAWSRLERGDFESDEKFFRLFEKDLTHPTWWKDFHMRKRQGKTKEAGVPTAASGIPAASPTQTASSRIVIQKTSQSEDDSTIPPLPTINGGELFWNMMSHSQTPDPYVWPAVRALQSNPRFLVGALSNTAIFPASHPMNTPPRDPALDVKGSFDLFISSAHVGMRKPEKRIYEFAMQKLREKWKQSGREEKEGPLKEEDVLFFDDIGANLKPAREVGWRTVRVFLGHTQDAVKELERYTGEKLSGLESKL